MIIGKIAQILDSSQFVLSIGLSHGVAPGMRFVIYEEGAQINDPDSGESLGALEIVKGEIEALHVQERMTLAASPSVTQPSAPPSVLSARMAETTRPASAASRQELYVQRSQIKGAPQRRPIQVGDFVRSLQVPDAQPAGEMPAEPRQEQAEGSQPQAKQESSDQAQPEKK